jgi:murein DD-endopeptidase MepM/ murein hydrolase activator NlpD
MMFSNYRITSPYGYRTHPVTGQRNSFHDGIDLVKVHKYPIPAFVGGKVLYAGKGRSGTGVGGYGNVVVIQDKKGSAHVYAHLHSVSVKKGQSLKQGDVIGKQGNTGKYTTGSHLHYEIRKTSSPSLGWVTDAEARTYNPTEYLKEYYQKEGELTVEQFNELKKLIEQQNKEIIQLKEELNKKQNKFPSGDIPSPSHSKNWIWFKKEGLTNGERPKEPVIREQLSTIMKDFHDKYIK